MGKDDAINIMKSSNVNKKVDCYNFCCCLKMSEETTYRRNKETILNRAKQYYKNYKERLREQARYKYRRLYEEEKK